MGAPTSSDGAPPSPIPSAALKRRAACALALAASLAALPAAANFVFDLSSRLIAITTAFVGTQVLLYGAVPQPGTEIAVVVRGPARDARVRRKALLGPIWINTTSLDFLGVPSFYAVAASLPLGELANPEVLARHELGPEHLRFTPADPAGISEGDQRLFHDALVRVRQRAGLYSSEPSTVSFLGDTLFRTRVTFPANVPPGIYQVQVLQFAGGEVIGAQTSTLEVAKMGVEAELYDLAERRPALYGLASIALALAAGWGANVMFKRG